MFNFQLSLRLVTTHSKKRFDYLHKVFLLIANYCEANMQP